MNNKEAYFEPRNDGSFAFLGFYTSKADAVQFAPRSFTPVTASDLYRTIEMAKEALNTIDNNHPTLKD